MQTEAFCDVKKQIRNGTVFWITGLAGAGKTTIASALSRRLAASNVAHVVLDGNRLRKILPWNVGYSSVERRQVAEFYSGICLELSSQGICVICATISLFHDIHRLNRNCLKSYYEIFLRVPLDEIIRRDTRNIYKSGDESAANIVGLDIEPEFPLEAHLVIDNYGSLSPEAACDLIMNMQPTAHFEATDVQS